MEGYARHVWLRVSAGRDPELSEVDRLAEILISHIVETRDQIGELHVHGAPSAAIQAHFAGVAPWSLGFREEVVLTPRDGLVTRARPDFFYPLSAGRGIIAEVERGGTTTNNHDLKDLWKAHVAPDVQHLFLIVPLNNWRADGAPRERPFPLVARRLGCILW